MAKNIINSVEEPEVWAFEKPKRADHIRVHRPDGFRGIPGTAYYHHGVYVSDSEVIHYSTPDGAEVSKTKARVMQTDLAVFLAGGNLETKVYNSIERLDLYPPDAVIAWARGCLDQGKYHLFFNNCEHFANCCTLGKHRSHQAERKFNVMGIISTIGKAISSFGGWLSGGSGGGDNTSRTTNSYTYEPDKVRIAEIERDTKLTLADKEKEMESMRQEFEAAMLQAKFRGLGMVFEALQKTFKEAVTLSEEHFSIVEGSSMEIVKKIEQMYAGMESEFWKDHESNRSGAFQLVLQLNQMATDSPGFPVWRDRVDKEMAMEVDLFHDSLIRLRKHRDDLVASSLKAKDKIIDQTNISKLLEKQMTLIQKNIEVALLSGKRPEIKQLPASQEKAAADLPKEQEIDITPSKRESEKASK
ncbi:MAG: lecithin retinol acyltransferase family protein [Candidatus Riflebacteria bacterium]|nr:lecithin retinol acyltransferase family protein [Candidatus Riflebacteria bacterium]